VDIGVFDRFEVRFDSTAPARIGVAVGNGSLLTVTRSF
jgi:hypothetical protein